MKKNKRIWIPIFVILGIILLPVILLTVFVFGTWAFGRIGHMLREHKATKYVNENHQELETMSEKLLAEYAGKDLPSFRGKNGCQTEIESPDENIRSIFIGSDENGHGIVRYGFDSTGMVVSGCSYDIIYSSEDDAIESFKEMLNRNTEDYKTEKTGDNEVTWTEGGDNGGMIRKIRDKFYLYEEWW